MDNLKKCHSPPWKKKSENQWKMNDCYGSPGTWYEHFAVILGQLNLVWSILKTIPRGIFQKMGGWLRVQSHTWLCMRIHTRIRTWVEADCPVVWVFGGISISRCKVQIDAFVTSKSFGTGGFFGGLEGWSVWRTSTLVTATVVIYWDRFSCTLLLLT